MQALLASHPQIEALERFSKYASDSDAEASYQRWFKFSVRGVQYIIEWWSNVSYLEIGEVRIPFNYLEINGHWPNRFKNNIVGRTGDNTRFILPLEEYQGGGQDA